LAKKKLFTLDYHDRLLGYVQRINDLKTSQCYATRTLFFLTSQGILKPVAIELSLPAKNDGDRPTARVICPPPKDSTKNWAWELAKAHVLSNDASFHQVISHWYDRILLKTFKLVLRFLLSLMHFMCIMMFIFIPRILRVVQRTCPLMGALALGEILFVALTSFKKTLVCHM
jgi:lipoxygenase